MIQSLTYDETGKITNPLSSYQPQGDEKDVIMVVRGDVQIGVDNLNQPFEEFNDLSLIERMNEDQRNWLGWSPEASDDPEEDWRWVGVRPIARNKIISTAAHLTQELIAPAVFAQNDQDEEDKTAGWIMGDLLEYNTRRSHYEQSFLYGVISGLVNPVSYFEVAFKKAYQNIWQGEDYQEVEDDELSGFQYELTRPEEILFENSYQFFLQKQGFVARRRRISKNEAGGIFGLLEKIKVHCDEMLVVDGHSTDSTRELSAKASAKVILDNRKGKGHAVRLAIKAEAMNIKWIWRTSYA